MAGNDGHFPQQLRFNAKKTDILKSKLRLKDSTTVHESHRVLSQIYYQAQISVSQKSALNTVRQKKISSSNNLQRPSVLFYTQQGVAANYSNSIPFASRDTIQILPGVFTLSDSLKIVTRRTVLNHLDIGASSFNICKKSKSKNVNIYSSV